MTLVSSTGTAFRAATSGELRAAVIGAGRISQEHLQFLRDTKLARLVALCDLSPALVRFSTAGFAGARGYTDYRRMLDEARPDVVHVLTPAQTHVDIVSAGLKAGAHVIVEKPVALTYGEFRQLWSLAEASGKLLVENHNYRFNDSVLAVEKLVDSGRLGEVREVDVRLALDIRGHGNRYDDANLPHASHELPAGVVHEFVTHLCYLTLRFLPGYDRVAAAWSNHGEDGVFKYDDLDALVIGGPVHARIRFSCQSWPDEFSLVLRGTRGEVRTDLFHPALQLVVPRWCGAKLSPFVNRLLNGMGLVRASLVGFLRKLGGASAYDGLQRFLATTYDALARGGAPPVVYDDMERTCRLVEALLEEAKRI